MKYSIVTKFIALALCALMVLTCGAGALGIFAMNEAGLYRRSWQEQYDAYRGDILQNTADNVAARYAAETLGGLDGPMRNAYYSDMWYLQSYNSGQMGYVLRDDRGKEVEELHLSGTTSAYTTVTSYVTDSQYPKVQEVLTRQEYEQAMGELKALLAEVEAQ